MSMEITMKDNLNWLLERAKDSIEARGALHNVIQGAKHSAEVLEWIKENSTMIGTITQ